MSCCSKPQKQQRKLRKTKTRFCFSSTFHPLTRFDFSSRQNHFLRCCMLTLKIFTQTLETSDEKSSKPVEKFCHTQSSNFPNRDFHFSQKIISQRNLREISRFFFVFHEFSQEFSEEFPEKFDFLSQFSNFKIFSHTSTDFFLV